MIIVKRFMILPFEFGQFQIHQEISFRIGIECSDNILFLILYKYRNENDKTTE